MTIRFAARLLAVWLSTWLALRVAAVAFALSRILLAISERLTQRANRALSEIGATK